MSLLTIFDFKFHCIKYERPQRLYTLNRCERTSAISVTNETLWKYQAKTEAINLININVNIVTFYANKLVNIIHVSRIVRCQNVLSFLISKDNKQLTLKLQ